MMVAGIEWILLEDRPEVLITVVEPGGAKFGVRRHSLHPIPVNMPAQIASPPAGGHAVFAETQHFFFKQRAAIEKLRADNMLLKEELMLENKFSVQPTTANAAALIAALQDQSDQYTRKIEGERSKVSLLEEKAGNLQEKVGRQRRKMGGINAAREEDVQMQKQMRILENRLEKAYHKYSSKKLQIGSLRDHIDNLRRERLVFDDVHRKLEKGLASEKREMAAIITQSNTSHEGRERALTEMAATKQAADQEQAEAMRAREIEDREAKTMQILKDEKSARKKVLRGTWSVAKDRTSSTQTAEKVKEYSEAFEKIQKTTGVTDLDRLVEMFMEAEDANFSLFNYVNEVNAEIEKLEDQIGEIRAEVERLRGESSQQESLRLQAVHDTEERLRNAEARAGRYGRKLEGAQRRVGALKQAIQDMFAQAGCDTPATRSMLGDGGVSEANLMIYLGIIEQRTNEILQRCMAASAGEPVEGGASPPVKPPGALGVTPRVEGSPGKGMVIDLPSTLADSDSDGDENEEVGALRPLDRQALEQKVLRSIARRGDGVGHAIRKARSDSRPISSAKF
ncbi:hypothetical protein WJX74_008491 [Apatococcus lobatus]|uniref:ODAD1 central coiled coil region domain-containing protein n=1 Tax=Apatococcus lobatus TaxID=904363 RepID=A0AAW1RNI0_9CHLO